MVSEGLASCRSHHVGKKHVFTRLSASYKAMMHRIGGGGGDNAPTAPGPSSVSKFSQRAERVLSYRQECLREISCVTRTYRQTIAKMREGGHASLTKYARAGRGNPILDSSKPMLGPHSERTAATYLVFNTLGTALLKVCILFNIWSERLPACTPRYLRIG